MWWSAGGTARVHDSSRHGLGKMAYLVVNVALAEFIELVGQIGLSNILGNVP